MGAPREAERVTEDRMRERFHPIRKDFVEVPVSLGNDDLAISGAFKCKH